MKYLLISFTILIIQDVTAQDALVTKSPPKKSTKIIVLVKDSSNTLMSMVAKALFDKGFTIDTKDENAKILSTKEFAPGHPSIFIKVRASLNDTGLVITGTYAWTLTSGLYPPPQEYTPIEYRGLKNSAAMQAWNSLDAIAKTFGDNIIYSK